MYSSFPTSAAKSLCHGLGGFYSQVGVADRPEDVKDAIHAPLLLIVKAYPGLERFSGA